MTVHLYEYGYRRTDLIAGSRKKRTGNRGADVVSCSTVDYVTLGIDLIRS